MIPAGLVSIHDEDEYEGRERLNLTARRDLRHHSFRGNVYVDIITRMSRPSKISAKKSAHKTRAARLAV
jgi:hypothetical protein